MVNPANAVVEEDLSHLVSVIVGLGRTKKFSKVSGIHFRVAREYIEIYDSLRPCVLGFSEEQLNSYDEIIDKAKKDFGYS